MRLLVVSWEFPPGPGGIGTHAFEIARHLTRRGWEVRVVSPQDFAGEEEIRSFNEAQPFTVVPVERASSRWRTVRSAWLTIGREVLIARTDVVVASSDQAVYLGVTDRKSVR